MLQVILGCNHFSGWHWQSLPEKPLCLLTNSVDQILGSFGGATTGVVLAGWSLPKKPWSSRDHDLQLLVVWQLSADGRQIPTIISYYGVILDLRKPQHLDCEQ
jgi:hypothetical protein